MSWNIVLDKVVEIKREYERLFGQASCEIFKTKSKEMTSLERWITDLCVLYPNEKHTEYAQILENLKLSQNKSMLLLRYNKMFTVETENSAEITEDFWDRYNGIYRECRSIVIDLDKECIILAPFRKFFNLNERDETKLEIIQEKISKAKVVEFTDKLDGSMQSARWYDNQIIMAGSQAVNPENSWRLEDGYGMIKENIAYEKMLREYPDYTFIFEYISLADAHLVKYSKEQEGLYLIGIRDVITGKEFDYNFVLALATKYNIPTTKLFEKTLEEILNKLDDKNCDEAEGFVINIDGDKVKLKYNDYVKLHHVLNKVSSANTIIRSIADDTYDDLLSKIPQAYHSRANQIASIVYQYVETTMREIDEYIEKAPKTNQKEFMIWIDKNVPKKLRSYCKEKYKGKEINVLRVKRGNAYKYKKLKDFGITDYAKLE